MYVAWALLNRPVAPRSATTSSSPSAPLLPRRTTENSSGKRWFTDLVDLQTADLNSDQYEDNEADKHDEEQHGIHSGILQRLYYWLA
jgi:hypothetical protein